jgi:voltage-gated potassium channel
MLKIRKRLFQLLEGTERMGRILQVSLMTLIALNVAAVMAASVQDLATRWERPLHQFELVSVTIFSIEYLLRLWVAPERAAYAHPLWGRLRYLVTPLAILDLLAVLPVFVPVTLDLRFLRTVRLMRMLRIAKTARYTKALKIIRGVLADRRDELLATASVLLLVVVLASSLMYEIEHDAQPTVYTSIPATLWWAIATLTTMGIDMRPMTPLGRLLAGCIAICGVGLFAIPAGILGSGFVEKYMAERTAKKTCPHCGKSLDKPPEGGAGPGV